MLAATLAGVRAHARRMFATALAVVFGVGFTAGTLIFSDTARAGFFDSFARVAKSVDVAVEPPSPAGPTPGDRTLLSTAQLAAVRALPAVAAADGRIAAPLPMIGRDGAVITNFGRAGVGVSTDGPARLRAFDVVGAVAANPGEAMLDTDTAAHQHLAIGDQVTVLDTGGHRHSYRLVGLLEFGTYQRFSGESVVGLPTSQIVALTGQDGLDEIVVAARPNVTPAALAARVRTALGGHAQVLTGDQRRVDLADSATRVAEQFRFILLIFAVISLVVAAFVIYNTFATLHAQRVRETALLRCVGATRRQVFASVLVESTVVGLTGAAAGVALGVGIARGLLGLLNGVLNAGIPVRAPVLTATPVLAGLAIGLLVTVAAALIPAVRATRTTPLSALHDLPTAHLATVRGRAVRLVVTGLLGAAGVALTVTGTHQADAQTGTFTIVAGGVVTFLAVLVCSPLLLGPLIAAVAALPGRLTGVPVRLASANARRNPGRTAVTAASLMIGVGLMSLFCVVVASVRVTAERQIAGHYPVDYVMTGVRLGESRRSPIPPGYARAVRARPEFSRVAETRMTDARIDGDRRRVGAVDPSALGTWISPEMASGAIRDLGTGTVVVSASRMPRYHTGDRVTVTVGRRSAHLTVAGTAATDIPGAAEVDALVSWDQLTALAGPGGDTTVMATAGLGVSTTTSRDALDSLTRAYPLVEVNSLADLSSSLDRAVNGLISLFGGLLATTVLISLFGIANTLSLSVVERTRESATLRALGLTRGQLRATLLVEALLMSLVAALVGIGYGLVYGRLVVSKAFAAIGPTLVIPWSWLAGLVLLAALAATVAAVLPARRAAKAPIVAAMAET